VETLYSGLDEVVQTTVVVYPNPSVNGSFNVKSDDIIKSIEVIDMLGRIINLPLNLSTDAVDGSRLESGKYIVRVTTEHAILMSEIVIVR
jgi:nicotinate-nucleotide pyrophosphorylase